MILVFIIIKFNKGVIMEYNDIRYGMDFWLNLFYCVNILLVI